MIYNHQHERVTMVEGAESLCPACSKPLIAKRGEVLVWHWAHKAEGHGRNACPFEESAWHLSWKETYSTFRGWEVEHPVTLDGKLYVLDVFNPATGQVYEFVHSLSPYYLAKHAALKAHFPKVTWTLDGSEFGAARAERTRDGRGVRKLLKPLAQLMSEKLQPHVSVHYSGELFREWKDNVWYPVRSERAQEIARKQAHMQWLRAGQGAT